MATDLGADRALVASDKARSGLRPPGFDHGYLEAENKRLRQIISDCAAALGNGAIIQPTSTVEFMGYLPDEIRLCVARLKGERP